MKTDTLQESLEASRRAAQERERVAAGKAEAELQELETARLEAEARVKPAEQAAFNAGIDVARQRADEAAQAEKMAEEKRTANKEHRATVEFEVFQALQLLPDVNEDAAADIIEAIKEGRIPHVSIAY